MRLTKIVFALLLFLLLLNGCANNVGGSKPSKPGALYVVRVSQIPQNDFAPFQTSVKDAKTVEQLYEAALALPSVPPGGVKHLCLDDPGLIYHLDFRPATLPFHEMTLNPGGCQLLYLGKTDARQMDSTFLSLFGKTIKVSWLDAPSL